MDSKENVNLKKKDMMNDEYLDISTPTEYMNITGASTVTLRRSGRVTRLDTEFSNDPYSTSSLRRSEGDEKARRTLSQILRLNSNRGMETRQPEEELSSLDGVSKNKYYNKLIRGLGTIGVVYGDLGTSPIYTLGPVFSSQFHQEEMPSSDDIIGAISYILWLLVVVVCVKYCFFVLSANYHGEGGSFAMYEKLVAYKSKMSPTNFFILTALSCLASSLLIGDATITPAISVISALEGISQVNSSFENHIVYVAVIIIVLLFALQYKGTRTIGLLFGPILFSWFMLIASIGIYSLNRYGTKILDALNPYSAVLWWTRGHYSGKQAFVNTANVILALTGAELMFADMGHFGRNSVTATWFTVVFPSLIFQYLGQGAYLLNISTPGAITDYSMEEKEKLFKNLANSPFWSMIPRDNGAVVFYSFVIVLGTLATIVASQSVISGAFTLMNQASALGFSPKLNVVYTNPEQKGQVYIGSICIIQGTICSIIIVVFQESSRLTAAFGAALTSVFFITTVILCFYIAPFCWNYRPITYISMFLLFGTIDGVMLLSSMGKFPNGAWLPFAMGIVFVSIMGIWSTTRRWVALAWSDAIQTSWEASPLTIEVDPNTQKTKLHFHLSVTRCDGVGLFLTPSIDTIPLALTRLCTRLSAAPRYLLIVTVLTVNEPFVAAWNRMVFNELEEKEHCFTYTVIIHHGWAEPLSSLNILQLLRDAATDEEFKHRMPLPIVNRFASLTYDDDEDSARFLNYDDEPLSIYTTTNKVKPAKERKLFQQLTITIYNFIKRNLSPTTVEYFRLPPDNTTEIGVSILA